MERDDSRKLSEAERVRLLLDGAWFHKQTKLLKFSWYSAAMTQDWAESFAAFLRKQDGLIQAVGAEREMKYRMGTSPMEPKGAVLVRGDWGVIGIFREGATTEAQSSSLLQILSATWWATVQSEAAGESSHETT